MHKICFFISKISSTGGTERVASLIASELAARGYKVYFFNLIGDAYINFDLHESIQIHTLGLPDGSIKSNFLKIILNWRKFIQNQEIDFIIDVDSILSVFSVLALFKLPTKHICWEHFNFNVDLDVKFRKVGRLLAAKYSDIIITLTDKDKNLWLNGITHISAKIVTIHNPSPYENVYNLPKLEQKTVLAVGRLTYQKGFDMLLDVWANLCKKNIDWKLLIVGDGVDKELLTTRVKELNIIDRVEFIPATKNIAQYYQSSSFYCMSSRFEGFGMVLLEAQAFGLPIVSFDCDCGPSDIVTNGINGFLVENGNVTELESKLCEMMKISRYEYEKMSYSAYENSKKFSLKESIIFKWVDLIENFNEFKK